MLTELKYTYYIYIYTYYIYIYTNIMYLRIYMIHVIDAAEHKQDIGVEVV